MNSRINKVMNTITNIKYYLDDILSNSTIFEKIEEKLNDINHWLAFIEEKDINICYQEKELEE